MVPQPADAALPAAHADAADGEAAADQRGLPGVLPITGGFPVGKGGKCWFNSWTTKKSMENHWLWNELKRESTYKGSIFHHFP